MKFKDIRLAANLPKYVVGITLKNGDSITRKGARYFLKYFALYRMGKKLQRATYEGNDLVWKDCIPRAYDCDLFKYRIKP